MTRTVWSGLPVVTFFFPVDVAACLGVVSALGIAGSAQVGEEIDVTTRYQYNTLAASVGN